MFQKFKDNQKETLCILRPDGTLSELASNASFLSDEKILEAYRLMVLARQADEWAVSLNRQGRMPTYPPNKGQEACAYGFESVRIDGNDLLAVYAATAAGTRIAREQGRPVLIEGYTYRLGAHTTADDPKLYRDETQVEAWMEKDPLIRLERYLQGKGLLSETETGTLKEQAAAQAKKAFERTESEPDPSLEDTFGYTFSALPPVLERQLQRRKRA